MFLCQLSLYVIIWALSFVIEKLTQELILQDGLEKISSLLTVPNQSKDVVKYGLGALFALAESGEY